MKAVVVIIQAYYPTSLPKIEYSFANSCELYVVSDLSSFKEYINELITKCESHLTVVVESKGQDDFTKVLRYLRDKTNRSTKSVENVYQKAATHYKGNDRTGIAGEFEVPLAFELVVLTWDTNLDQLNEKTIYAQQFLRVIALLHGGLFLLVLNESGPDNSVYNVEWICDLVEKISPRRESQAVYCEPKPVYDPQSLIRILIPNGWDSWSKIKLLLNSFRGTTGANSLLKSDQDILTVVTAYSRLSEEDQKVVANSAAKQNTDSESYQEFLARLDAAAK